LVQPNDPLSEFGESRQKPGIQLTEMLATKRRFAACANLVTIMEDEIDYTKHTEAELVDMFGRLDPRWAPAECTRLAKLLTELGYIVTPGATGPGSAAPGTAKLQALIGSSSPFECEVDFGPTSGPLSYLKVSRNCMGFIDSGSLVCDGVYVWISGRVLSSRGLPSLFQENAQLACRQIANVESQGRMVRFECNVENVAGDAINLWLADATAAARLVRILPKRRTKDFHPRLAQ
jgi:hypothetical protein